MVFFIVSLWCSWYYRCLWDFLLWCSWCYNYCSRFVIDVWCTWCYSNVSNGVQMCVVVLRCIWCSLGVVNVIWLLNYLVVCKWCFLWHTLIWHTPPLTFMCFFACGVFTFPSGWYFWHALMCRLGLQLKVGAWWFLACNKFAFQVSMF